MFPSYFIGNHWKIPLKQTCFNWKLGSTQSSAKGYSDSFSDICESRQEGDLSYWSYLKIRIRLANHQSPKIMNICDNVLCTFSKTTKYLCTVKFKYWQAHVVFQNYNTIFKYYYCISYRIFIWNIVLCLKIIFLQIYLKQMSGILNSEQNVWVGAWCCK